VPVPEDSDKTRFDAVEFQHRAGAKITAELAGLTARERAEYWRTAMERLERLQAAARARKQRADRP